jgi:hypothetical protein
LPPRDIIPNSFFQLPPYFEPTRQTARFEAEAMANVYYKDRLIIAYSSFQQSSKLWSAGAEITWKTGNRRQSHTMAGFTDTFKSSEEAEQFAIRAAQTWIDADG